ncbi:MULTISPECIES: homoserine dehydrogenase [unclassified Actinomyces]|uniref:homoserine dehydrogenase n=1 Tax=unclassified Actinomyces TaxID=2609248 RepID=UPI0020179A33|nr:MULTISPECIES: homoserine dehydrogenase [unclassified Actinomyces]MCL3778419.1 homoserine dehydrogenase [Actinomyces sp. AC-20-1]MCL3790727.1 homoserine dehydrogenase [Actinomyces sp. 187325]MCL3795141.1 homoserine dehydrogenase [Actinomyces sp. 217892]
MSQQAPSAAPASPASRPVLKVGVLGSGTVGTQVVRLLGEQAEEFAARSGARLEVTGIAVRDLAAPRDPAVPRALLSDDATAVATGNDIVIELIGGIEPARTLILAAFGAGASVITGNKALIAAHGPELYAAAAAADVDFYYEAAVAGAIPVVYALRESMAGDRVTSVLGIVNGTTNYILDEMSTKGLSFEAALATAQELGYAEADPTADVDGLDAAAKAAIIASLAFHTRVGMDDVTVEGIRSVTAEDIREAHASGCEIKLLAIAQRVALTDGPDGSDGPEDAEGVSVRVHPALVPADHPLASVHGAFNAVLVEAESAGRLMFYGKGAGGAPTASAVLSDVVAAAAHRVNGGQAPRESSYADLPVLGPEAAVTRYQVQLRVDDQPGSLAAVAAAFAANGVSINSVRQSAYVGGDQAVVTIVTHPAAVTRLDAAVEALRSEGRVLAVVSIQRVEGE